MPGPASIGSTEIEKSLAYYLKNLAALVAIVGDKIDPWKSPRSPHTVAPRVTYTLTSNMRVENIDGPNGMGKPMFRIDCWGTTYEQSKLMAHAIRGTRLAPALDGYRGQFGSHFVQRAKVIDAADDSEEPMFGDDEGDPRVSLSVQLWYNEGT